MKTPMSLRIVTFGPRGAGKTVSLSAAYLVREGAGMQFVVTDPGTISYLRPLAEGLARGEFPPPNPPKAPERLAWKAITEEQTYEVECIDFAGELVDPVWRSGPEKLKTQVADWFGSADAVLLYVDATTRDPLALDAIDTLVTALTERTTRHGSEARAVAVVLTKADELPGATHHALSDPTACEALLSQHPIANRLRAQLNRESHTSHCALFLTSAVGWNFTSIPDPRRRTVEPCNLFEPIRWALEQGGVLVHASHERMLQDVEQELEALTFAAAEGWFSPTARLIRRLDTLVAQHRLMEGPLAERATQQRQDLVRLHHKHRLSFLTSVALLLTLLIVGTWTVARRNRGATFQAYADVLLQNQGDAGVRTRLAFFDQHIGPYRNDGLLGLRSQRAEAEGQRDEDLAVLRRQEATEAFEALLSADPTLAAAEQHPRRHQAIVEYRTTHGQFLTDERIARLTPIATATQSAWEAERRAFTEAARCPIETPRGYALRSQRLKEYCTRKDALTRDQATQLIDNLAKQEAKDRKDYSEFRDLAEKAHDANTIKSAERLGQRYLKSSDHCQAMSRAVKEYLEGLKAFKQDRWVKIRVNQVRVPDQFVGIWPGKPAVSVKVGLAGRNESTTRITCESRGDMQVAEVGQELGPFTVRWGKSQDLVVSIEVHRLIGSEKASTTLHDNEYILNHVRGTIKLKGKSAKGPRVEVDLDCQDTRPALPPPYGEP